MADQFYYADENSQPVGPLSLEEIRRIADAGVIPSDVMICEAGGEDWKPLYTFATPPRSAPPRTAPPSGQSKGGATTAPIDPDRTANRLHRLLSHAIAVVVLYSLLDMASRSAAGDNGGVDPNGPRAIFTGVAGLWAAAAEMILVFHICRTFPLHLRFTTPAKAAWFMLIPGFNIYWAFRLLPGFAEATAAWDREAASSAGHRKPAPGWLLPVAYTSAVLIGISTILILLQLAGVIQTSEAASTLFVIDYGLRFTVYITVVSVIKGVLVPSESLPKEKQKDSIWTLLSLGLVAIIAIVKALQALKIIDF